MNRRRIEWSSLMLFAATAVMLEGITTASSIEVFPTMKGKIWCAFIATVVLAFLIHQIADEEDSDLRQKGLIVFGFLNIALLVNALQHFDYGRELSASNQSVVEINQQADKDLARDKERAAIATQMADANAKQLKAGRDTLLHVSPKQAGKFVDRLQSALIVAPVAQATPSATPDVNQATSAAIKTPAQLRAELMPNLFWGLVLSFGLSVLGATALFIFKQWDRDGDGVKDWIQRAAKTLGEEDFRATYPKLYGLHKPDLFPPKD